MDALFDLFFSLVNVFWSLLDVVTNLVRVILPWLPLLGWVGFWTFAVNWAKAFPDPATWRFHRRVAADVCGSARLGRRSTSDGRQTPDAWTVGRQSCRKIYLRHDVDLHCTALWICSTFRILRTTGRVSR